MPQENNDMIKSADGLFFWSKLTVALYPSAKLDSNGVDTLSYNSVWSKFESKTASYVNVLRPIRIVGESAVRLRWPPCAISCDASGRTRTPTRTRDPLLLSFVAVIIIIKCKCTKLSPYLWTLDLGVIVQDPVVDYYSGWWQIWVDAMEKVFSFKQNNLKMCRWSGRRGGSKKLTYTLVHQTKGWKINPRKNKAKSPVGISERKQKRWWTTTPNHSAWNHRTRAFIHKNDEPREDESSKLLFFVVAVSRWYYQQQTKRYRKGNGRSDSTLFQNDSISCGRRLYHSTNHRHGRFTSRERAKNERIRRLGQ